MLQIRKGVPKPKNLRSRHSTATKYPLADMEPGDFFSVPYGDMREGDTPQIFRKRIHQSVRNWAARSVTDQRKPAFTVEIIEEDDTENPPSFVAGDVGVWCDA